MKIRCIKKNLEKALQGAENFLGKKMDLEILEAFLLTAENNFLKIESTNIDTSFKAEIPVILEKEGKVAVTGEIFYKIIAAIKDNELFLESDEKKLKIISENSDMEIKTLNYEDFPAIISLEEQNKEELLKKVNFISIKDFINGLESTYYATSKSNIKPELSSIYIYNNKNIIYFVGTDGFRLAEKNFSYSDVDLNEKDFEILLPGDSVNPIIKTLSLLEENEELEIYFYKNQIFFKTQEYLIFSRLIEGQYVDYKKIMPEENNLSVIFLKNDFLDSLKLINIFSDEFNQVKFFINKEGFFVETKNEIGINKNKIDSVIKGNEYESKFNYRFIQDSFSSIKTDSVEFVFNENKPLLIKPVGDKSFRYIVMSLSK